MAKENLWLAWERQKMDEPNDFFGLAITGAHYPNRPSNVWVYLATSKWNAHMHFEVAASEDRSWAGSIVNDRVKWFMNACLLSTVSWRQHIEEIGDSLETHNIDVLYAPGVSDAERLLLLRPNNPLAFRNGKFQRVIDVIRGYGHIYPGAFNPPTKEHLSNRGSLFEISQEHYYKGGLSIGDMIHRMRMLDLEDKAVLLTQAPRFVDKYKVLKERLPRKQFTFLLGMDAWSATIAHHQYPSETWLSEQMPAVAFEIMPRPGHVLYENGVSKHLPHRVLDGDGSAINSSAVRESDNPSEHEYLTPAISEYVAAQGLYSESGVPRKIRAS